MTTTRCHLGRGRCPAAAALLLGAWLSWAAAGAWAADPPRAAASRPAASGAAPTAKVDLNSADVEDLRRLGLGEADAKVIVSRRRQERYETPHDLVSRGILSEAKFRGISGHVTAGR